MSQYSLCKIFNEEDFHEYKAEACQLLLEDDVDRRLEFTYVVLQHHQNDPYFLRKIKFSDECLRFKQQIQSS